MSAKEEIAAATAKRMAIVDALLELLTGPEISSQEMARIRFVGDIFKITPVIQELCASASSIQGRQELALAAALAALNVALDDTHPPPSKRVLEAREHREAGRIFKARLNPGKG